MPIFNATLCEYMSMLQVMAKAEQILRKEGKKMPQITLKAARVNKELTQEQAAKLMGVSVSTIKNWENKKTAPTYPQVKRICEIYGVSSDYIRL